jgi:hypothetical protein
MTRGNCTGRPGWKLVSGFDRDSAAIGSDCVIPGFVHPESSRTGSGGSNLIDTHTDSETDTEVNVIWFLFIVPG